MENEVKIADADFPDMSRDWQIVEVIRLRNGIRVHWDATGLELCWHHPKLCGLLPNKVSSQVAVPPWPKFMRGCIKYRESLDEQLPAAPTDDHEEYP